MSYIEQSINLVAELKEKHFKPSMGGVVGRSETGGIVTNIGKHVFSNGEEIYLALKTKVEEGGSRNKLNQHNIVSELAGYSLIEELYPTLKIELPKLVGLVKHTSGEVIGILMEDFSQNEKYYIRGIPYLSNRLSKFPKEFLQILDEVDPTRKESLGEDLASAIFYTTPSYTEPQNLISRRLGDPTHIAHNLINNSDSNLETRYKHHKEIEEKLNLLSIEIDHWKSGGYEWK